MNKEEWEEFPSYLELFRAIKGYLWKQFQDKSSSAPQAVYNIYLMDVLFVIFFTFGWYYVREFITKRIFKPLGHRYALTPSNQLKMPESAWKFLYFLIGWLINLYILVLSGEYKFFQKPSTIFSGWSLNESIPRKIYLFYVAQCGFYIHSLYATLYIDEWRKDYIAMIVHHLSSITLTVFSFALRCHNIGCMVILCHDICDVFMEFTKLNIYFKIQNGKLVKIHEILANVSFLCFTVAWIIGRLYCFPLRVIYAGISDVNKLQSVLPHSLLMNSLLWTLQILHIYWFYYILQIFWRIACGQTSEDIRECNNVDENLNQKPNMKLS